MRTTLTIDDNVLANAKARARERGITLGEYVERALRHEGDRPEQTDGPEIPVFHGRLRQRIDEMSNREIQALLDEGVPLDKLR